MSHRLLSLGVVSAVLAGCASIGDTARTTRMAGVEGGWVTPVGRHVEVQRGEGDRYTFTVTDADRGAPGVYPARFLKVGSDTILEVQVAEPRPEGGGEPVPVRIYGRMRVEGDTFEFAPLGRAWLEREAARIGGLRVTSVPGNTRTSAAGTSIAVGDPSKIGALLRDAAQDPAAFDQPTVLRRAR